MSADPHPLFDSEWYLQQNPDVAAAEVNPLQHYMEHGWREGRDPHPLFDTSFYLERNPDVAANNHNPLAHYMEHGWHEGRDPSPHFSSRLYLEKNADVAKAQVNPLVHYLYHGHKEGRAIAPADETHVPRVKSQRILERHSIKWDQLREEEFLANLKNAKINSEWIKASIIMPTRNRAYCIQRAILSVLAQTHSNWELIIIDDGSQDDTARIVDSVSDTRIKYFKNEVGRGVSAARNKGLAAACGDWVFFLDSDNSWRPSMLEQMLKFATMRGLSAAYCGADVLDDDGKTKSFLYFDFEMESLLVANYIDLNCFCVRRQASSERFDERLKRLVDWDYILRIASHTTLVGAPFIGVDYYDGDEPSRITRREHTDQESLDILMNKIRSSAISAILDRQTAKAHSKIRRIAVVFHIYHKEFIALCLSYIKNITAPYDLFVTTSHSLDDTDIAAIRREAAGAILLQYPNVGSDIAPFLELTSTLATYDLVCKVHTKRDAGKWGGAWRDYMLHSMLGSKKIVDEIVASFDDDHNVVAAGAAPFYKLGEANSIPKTYALVRDLAISLGFERHLTSDWSFFAGTMFWVRPHLLSELARFACDHPSYSQTFQRDGAVEHAWERLVGMALLQVQGSKVAICTVGKDLTCRIEVIPAAQGAREGITVTLDKIVASRIDFARKREADVQSKLKVTTIIPTYNQEYFIRSAIDSAVMQVGDFEHEILISDDGSTDGTNAIVDEYVEKYPTLIRNIGSRVNYGISENFRRCFSEASGKYIAILEGDDYWSSDQKLNKQVRFLEENEDCSMVFSKIEVHDIEKNTRRLLDRQNSIRKKKLDGADFLAHPSMNLIANLSCCMFKSDIIKSVPALLYDNRINEIAIAFYMERFGKIGFIDEVMSLYQQHSRGAWTGKDRRSQLESGLQTREVVKKIADKKYRDGIQKIIDEKYIKPLLELG